MKKKILIIILSIIAFLIIWVAYTWNSLTTQEESVKSQWANVENQYQRRADLIPNLVRVVKGYTAHENETLTEVTEARSRMTQATVDLNSLNADNIKNYREVQGEISSALNRLMVVAESYPDLKADKSFLELQAQLEGTENRISTERGRYNQASREYNTAIRRIPALFISGLLGFGDMPYFEAEKGSDIAPNVDFNK